MEQSQICVFTKLVNTIVNDDNVYKPETYFNKVEIGDSFGFPCSFKAAYVRGAGYISGHIGRTHIEAFYSNTQGWQVMTTFEQHYQDLIDLLQVQSKVNEQVGPMDYFHSAPSGAQKLITTIEGRVRFHNRDIDDKQDK